MALYLDIINEAVPEMKEAVSYLEREMKEMRTNKASPALIENLKVDYYETKTPLKQIAAILVSGQRSLTIQPWDSNYLKAIEKAVLTSNLGLTSAITGKVIQVQLPPLTEEYRQDLIKLLSTKIEKTKVILRQVREKAWKEIQTKTKQGTMSEDDKFRAKDKLQKIVDEHIQQVENLREKKEKEISVI